MIFITGMHRSGTSMVTRLLNICGLYLGPKERLMPAFADNPAGFWEDMAAVRINEAVLITLGGGWDYLPADVAPGWEQDPRLDSLREQAKELIRTFDNQDPWGWKDPRFSFTLPFWQPHVPDSKVIICLRHPLDVANSLFKRNGHSLAFGFNLWREHNQHLLDQTTPEQRLVTCYDAYFTNPHDELRRLVSELDWSITEETILQACETVSDKLRHHHTSSQQTQQKQLPANVSKLYQDLLSEAGYISDESAQDLRGAYRSIEGARALELQPRDPDRGVEGESTTFPAPQDITAPPLASIIMLTFNALEYTKQCIDSIRRHTAYPHEIIFVDNGSTDGTKDYLQQLVASESNYQLLDNESNLGFSAGNNQGVREAKGEYVLLLNNDVLVSEGWLESLVAGLERDEHIGMVGPVSNYVSGRQRIAEVPYQNDEEFYGFAKSLRAANRDKVTPRRRIAGFAMLVRKALYDDLGGLDESFGSGNYEDDDFCLRVREKGYAVMVDESTFIHHFGSQTFSDNKIDYQASLKHNEELFRTKWPDVDPAWLLEQDESLVQVLTGQASEAIKLVNNGDLDAGRKLCEDILREDPIRVEAVYGLALIAHLSGDFGEARKYYQQSVSLQRDWIPAQHSLALLDMAEGNMSGAQLRLVEVLEKNPDDIDSRRLLGQALIETEQFDEGISLLMGILQDDPNDWQTHFILASLYAEVDRNQDAKRHLEAVLAANPDHVEAQEMLAKIGLAE
ncbi:MAG: glycosyltransferase [Fidelibacterota bacterium]|nr:MAG: glycosyltransferase [Candidatus Neomarinimicrobiota bacterium]